MSDGEENAATLCERCGREHWPKGSCQSESASPSGSALPPEIADIVPAVAREFGYIETHPVTLSIAWIRWGREQPLDKVLDAVMYVRAHCVKDNNALAALLEQAWSRLKAQNR